MVDDDPGGEHANCVAGTEEDAVVPEATRCRCPGDLEVRDVHARDIHGQNAAVVTGNDDGGTRSIGADGQALGDTGGDEVRRVEA